MLRTFTQRPYKTVVRRFAASEAAGAIKSKKAILQLIRFDPEKNNTRVETYEYDKHHDYMVLDLLIAVKAHQDPTLAFRSSCCEGVCGSCAMNINGVNSLACISFAQDVTTVGPLPNFPVIKDMVVDLRYFFQQYAFTRPFVRNVNLSRNRIDGIVDRYNTFSWVMHGINPADAKTAMLKSGSSRAAALPSTTTTSSAAAAAKADGAAATATQQEQPPRRVESEVLSMMRLAEALCEAGNVTQLVAALERVERYGIILDGKRVVELLEKAVANHAAKAAQRVTPQRAASA